MHRIGELMSQFADDSHAIRNSAKTLVLRFMQSSALCQPGELDVVVLGASPDLAERIDRELKQHGTSLTQMTLWDYAGTLSEDPRYSYMRAVVGLPSAGAP